MTLSNPLALSVDRLGPRDAAFIYNESDGHLGHFVTVWLFDSSAHPAADLTRAQAVEWMAARLGCDRMYTDRIRRAPLGLAHPYWAPAEGFEVGDHVTVTEIAVPGWDGFGAHLDSILTARMDLDRPPWEMHVFTGIEGLEDFPGRLTAVVMKTHHSAVDGLGAVLLAQKLFAQTPSAGDSPPTTNVPFTRLRMLVEAMSGAPRGMVRMASTLRHGRDAAREIAAAAESGLWPAPHAARRPSRVNMKFSGTAALQALVFQADDFQRVRDGVPGATINDVLLATVGGALARYLAGAGEESEDSVIALVPRSMRQIEEWESANQLVVMSVDMHSGVADPVKRMALIAESARGEKMRTSHIASRRLVAAEESAPPILQRLVTELRKFWAADPERPGAWHTMVSNIPMSLDGLTVYGAPCVGMLGGQPPVDKDCVRHFLSVAAGGKLVLSVIADRAAIPDLPHYRELIQDSFDELKEAAGSK